jgi:hypothetical protein
MYRGRILNISKVQKNGNLNGQRREKICGRAEKEFGFLGGLIKV